MARINFDEVDNYSNNNGTDWLRLQNDGDNTLVQFLFRDLEDLDIYSTHEVLITNDDGSKTKRYVDCKRNYNDPLDICPLCADGNQPKPLIILSLYDHKDNKVKIWQRGKKFLETLKGYLTEYPDLTKVVFRLVRNGAKGDQRTTYTLIPATDVAPINVEDVERPNLLGNFILDKNADEMRVYLDTKSFPKESNDTNGEQQVVRRSRRG